MLERVTATKTTKTGPALKSSHINIVPVFLDHQFFSPLRIFDYKVVLHSEDDITLFFILGYNLPIKFDFKLDLNFTNEASCTY